VHKLAQTIATYGPDRIITSTRLQRLAAACRFSPGSDVICSSVNANMAGVSDVDPTRPDLRRTPLSRLGVLTFHRDRTRLRPKTCVGPYRNCVPSWGR